MRFNNYYRRLLLLAGVYKIANLQYYYAESCERLQVRESVSAWQVTEIGQTDRFELSSLPKQGSRNASRQWIPAFAGMTARGNR